MTADHLHIGDRARIVIFATARVASSTHSRSQKQGEDVCLQSFPPENESSNNATLPVMITGDKATEVALLAFSPEQHDRDRQPTDSAQVPLLAVVPAGPPIPVAPHSVAPPRAARAYRFPVRQLALVLLVGCMAAAALAMFTPEQVPATSVPAAALAPADVGAASTTSNEPTGPTPAAAAAEATPVATSAMAPRVDRTTDAARRAAVKRNRVAARVPLRRPAVAAKSTAVSAYKGSLAVSSSPEGAKVFVNGVPAGVTPVLLRDVAAGSRAVRLELPGHERWSSAVRIIASEQTRVVAKLRPSSTR